LIFDELLFYIKRIPFDHIIENNLQNNNNAVYQITEANSLNCLFTADRKLINSTTIDSFRFANECHPEFYRTFEIKTHYLFRSISQQRHAKSGWYQYIGKQLLNRIDDYLNIQKSFKIRIFIKQNYLSISMKND
jgi:hypothetical protein